jgi:hypothetical protein
MSKTFTVAEVAKHKDEKDGMYIIIDSGVYDIASMFLIPIHSTAAHVALASARDACWIRDWSLD